MVKKVLILTLIASLLVVGSAFAEISKTAPAVNHKHMTGDEVIDVENAIPYNPGVATDSPGDIIGYTFYDNNTNDAKLMTCEAQMPAKSMTKTSLCI